MVSMGGPLRILQIFASHKWTGPAEGVVRLTRGLQQRGHEAWLLCAAQAPRLLQERAERIGVRPVEILSLKPQSAPWSLAADPIRLASFIRRVKPDIVHAHLSHDHAVSIAAGWFGAGRVPVARTIHHHDSLGPRPLRSRLYHRTEGFTTVCRAYADRLHREYGIPESRIEVIPESVDTDRFRPLESGRVRQARAGMGIPHDAPVVGMVARFQPHRRHGWLLQAAVRLRSEFPSLRILLVGRGEHRDSVEAEAGRLGLSQAVIFTGYRDRDLHEMYGVMDVMVLLNAGSDGSCRAVLEAMAGGRPVVAAAVGAVPETVLEGITGFVIPEPAGSETDVDVLIKPLRELLSDRSLAVRFGAAARARIEAGFQEEQRLDRYEAFYRRVAAQWL
jgi:glycosyltransferase involved in cell wall biosynthesis